MVLKCLEYCHDDNIWFVTFPDLPGCMADGETEEEAIKMANIIKDEWLEVAFEE